MKKYDYINVITSHNVSWSDIMSSRHSTNKYGEIGKICSKCKLWYLISIYPKDKTKQDGLGCLCKCCHKKYRQKHMEHIVACRNEQQVILDKIKSGCGCAICGYNDYPESLDFHHNNSKYKRYHINKDSITREDFIDEIQKCTVLCKNCHAHITRISKRSMI